MEEGEPLRVGIPEPLERRARLGPFASGADALKFALWAAVGALVASVTIPAVWLPFLAGGFWISAHRVDGRTPDERLLAYARWRLRPRSGPAGSSDSAAGPGPAPLRTASGGGLLRLPSGRWVAVLRAGGLPLRHLPRVDAERLFDAFRTLLRATSEGVYLCAGVEPFPTRPYLPLPLAISSDTEADAWAGYDELVRLLVRRRFRRRVWVGIPGPARDAPAAASATQTAADLWRDGLRALGVRCEWVSGPSLDGVRSRFGWRRAAPAAGGGT